MTTLSKLKHKVKPVQYQRGAGGFTHDCAEVLWDCRPAEQKKRDKK